MTETKSANARKKNSSNSKRNRNVRKVKNMGVKKFMSKVNDMNFASDFNEFGLIPKSLGINRPIKEDHVLTLSTIISNGGNYWHSVLVIKNEFKVRRNYFDKKKIEKHLHKNENGTYSIIDEDGNVPKYIIIDGQHRYLAFRNKNTSFPYADVTASYDIEYLDDIIDIVNDFNIGESGYNQRLVREKKLSKSPYLKYFDKITKKVTIQQQIQRSITQKQSGDNHISKTIPVRLNDKKCPYKVSFVNKSVTGLLKKEVDKHRKSNYMCMDPLSDELKSYMDDIVLLFIMINNLMKGYTPYQPTVYTYLSKIMGKITYNDISFENFIEMLEEHLTNERDVFLDINKYELNNRVQLQGLTDVLFGNMNNQVLRMLTMNKIPHKYNKEKGTFEV